MYWTGHINHSLFWKNLAPAHDKGGHGGVLKSGPLKEAIDAAFGSVENLKKEFNAQTAAIQGSGWGWLVSFRLSSTLGFPLSPFERSL
jgi:superoxide dismutase, Fe-Mn family